MNTSSEISKRKTFIKDANVRKEKQTLLNVSALHVIFSKFTFDLSEGQWVIIRGTCRVICVQFCGCQVCRKVSEGDQEFGEGAKDNGGVSKSRGELGLRNMWCDWTIRGVGVSKGEWSVRCSNRLWEKAGSKVFCATIYGCRKFLTGKLTFFV